MRCRNCGTEIAANALICFKCGTATSEPKIVPPGKPRGRSPLAVVGILVLVVALAALVRVAACGSLL